jgi:membrane protein implicated in regulation of membrane protease activity
LGGVVAAGLDAAGFAVVVLVVGLVVVPDGFVVVPGLAGDAVPGLVVVDTVPGFGAVACLAVPVVVGGFVAVVVWAARGNPARPSARTDSAARARRGREALVRAMVSTSGQESRVG